MTFRLFRRSHAKAKQPAAKDDADADVQEKLRQARDYGASLGAAPEAQQDVAPPAEEPVPPTATEQQDAVLTDEDERFLERLASQAEEGAAPSETGTAETSAAEEEEPEPEPPAAKDDGDKKRKSTSWFSMPEGYTLSSFAVMPSVMPSFKRQKSNTALPVPVTAGATAAEERKERTNIDNILHRLQLDTDKLNNRAVSLSDDTKKLLADFNQLVRDVIAGAPYAYDDLERFFRQRHGEIEKLYDGLPPFLQAFVRSLPAKLVTSYAPELAAAAGLAATGAAGAAADGKPARKKGTVPTLKRLVATRGAVASGLRSTLAFLETRFPLLLGWTNVLVSLALFILLFVFWYCYKRGREERAAAEDVAAEVERMADKPLAPAELEEAAGGGEERADA